jgi:hypothetical protein
MRTVRLLELTLSGDGNQEIGKPHRLKVFRIRYTKGPKWYNQNRPRPPMLKTTNNSFP